MSAPDTPNSTTPMSTVSGMESLGEDEPFTPMSAGSETDYIGHADMFMNGPSTAETVFEDEDCSHYDEASDKEIATYIGNPAKAMYYCNGKMFRFVVGALRESVKTWPTKEIFRCNFNLWDVRRNYSRYSLISRDFSIFFDNATSYDILQNARSHMTLKPTRNPFIYNDSAKKILKVYWSNMPNFREEVCTHTSGELPMIVKHYTVCMMEKRDSVTLCWAAMMRSGLKTLSENPQHFWQVYETMLLERHMLFHEGKLYSEEPVATVCKSMFLTIVQQSSASFKSRAMRYKRVRSS